MTNAIGDEQRTMAAHVPSHRSHRRDCTSRRNLAAYEDRPNSGARHHYRPELALLQVMAARKDCKSHLFGPYWSAMQEWSVGGRRQPQL